MCVIHEVTWHEGETCEEYDSRSSGRNAEEQRAQEEASLAAIRELSKKCPGPKCVYDIEKNHGCDHMTCKLGNSRTDEEINYSWGDRFKMPLRILLDLSVQL
jgi:hypothetical protein